MANYPNPHSQPPKKSGLGTGAIIAIVVLCVVVFGGGIFGVLGIYGVRKYVANAKTAEAKNSLGQIAKDAAAAYEASGTDASSRHLCPSATAPIPFDRKTISGKKYQSTSAEWSKDQGKNAGFACLKFELSAPQYFQYEYTSTPTGFVARAHGDLNGDGVFSLFEIQGQIKDGQLLIAPALNEINPEE